MARSRPFAGALLLCLASCLIVGSQGFSGRRELLDSLTDATKGCSAPKPNPCYSGNGMSSTCCAVGCGASTFTQAVCSGETASATPATTPATTTAATTPDTTTAAAGAAATPAAVPANGPEEALTNPSTTPGYPACQANYTAVPDLLPPYGTFCSPCVEGCLSGCDNPLDTVQCSQCEEGFLFQPGDGVYQNPPGRYDDAPFSKCVSCTEYLHCADPSEDFCLEANATNVLTTIANELGGCSACDGNYTLMPANYPNVGELARCQPPCVQNCARCDEEGICSTCNPGYAPDEEGQCVEGPPNCLLALNATACKTCNVSYVLEASNKTCKACPESCQNCNAESGICYGCISGYGLNAEQNTCTKCKDENCQTCTFSIGDETCLLCAFDGYGLDIAPSPAAKCIPCQVPNCFSCPVNGTSKCDICAEGWYVDKNATDVDKMCLRCDEQCGTCEKSGVCLTCKANQAYDKDANECLDCGPNCRQCNANEGATCFECEQGFVLAGGNCSAAPAPAPGPDSSGGFFAPLAPAGSPSALPFASVRSKPT